MALGASQELIAKGIGISLAELQDLERGVATDRDLDTYSTVLTRMEAWSTEEREIQYLRARLGLPFTK